MMMMRMMMLTFDEQTKNTKYSKYTKKIKHTLNIKNTKNIKHVQNTKHAKNILLLALNRMTILCPQSLRCGGVVNRARCLCCTDPKGKVTQYGIA